MDKCIKCNDELTGSSGITTLGERGIEKLVSVSVELGDNLFAGSKKPTVGEKIHKFCFKNYTRESSVRKSKRMSLDAAESDEAGPSMTKKLRSDQDAFNFKLHCLFCGESADKQTHIPVQRRREVHTVETLTFFDSPCLDM